MHACDEETFRALYAPVWPAGMHSSMNAVVRVQQPMRL